MGVSCCGNQKTIESEGESKKDLLNDYSKTILIKKNYELLSNLGAGSFGKVRLFRSNYCSSMQFAVKTMKIDRSDRPLFNCYKNEVNVLRSTDHPNIVNFIESYEADGFIHIVTEYLKGKDLQNLIRYQEEEEYEEPEVCLIMKQILRALKYLHGLNIVHRDLKPENIIFAEEKKLNTLKVIDFGLATFVGTHDRKSCGSPYYMAPEMVDGEYNVKSDVWSAGIILYQMITKKFPFENDDEYNVLANVVRKKLDLGPVKQTAYSKECQNFLVRLLEKDVEKRPSSSEALEDPWFKMHNLGSEKLDKKTKKKMKEIFEAEETQVDSNKKMNIINKFKSFARKNLFQKEILYYIARINGEEELSLLKNLFIQTDRKCKGTINLEGFKEAFYDDNIKARIDESEFETLFNQMTFHNREQLAYSEFIAAVLNGKDVLLKEKVKMAFKYFEDIEKKGVTDDSFIRGIEAFNVKVQKAEIRNFFKSRHLKNDVMEFETFFELLNKTDMDDYFLKSP